MISRVSVVTLTLALSACGQPSTPPAESDPSSPGNALPVASELLANAPLAGTWEGVGDGATVGVRFTPKDYPDTLTIGCDGGTLRAFINWTTRDPVQSGEVRVYTAAKTETFAAMGTNEGLHLLNVSVAGNDPRLAVLKVRQDRFAVQGFGQAIVVPWVPRIGEVLNECVN